ncbi:Lrp/AsnC family transcriptional regulator [Brevirhabdus sp.]|uniref:Lrp/AsnC family transcriptional regulator n=1 Tax=Brevirhabdus sp. TaxID=2004514 RepID=UPI004059922F
MLDDTDRRILRHFQAEPELTTAQLAERAGVTPATCWRRLDRLQSAGVIKGIEAVIDWAALGYGVEVSLRLTLDKTQRNAFDAFLAAARDLPDVHAIQTFLGRVDLRMTVRARDMPHYQEIYRRHILQLPHIAEIEALMLVSTVKSDRALPL